MAWVFLFVAGIFEIGWPVGFKLSQATTHRVVFIAAAVLSMALSGYFLWLAQKQIPIGTAYAVWTGIGAAGTFVIGIVFFGDATGLLRVLSFLLILAGIVGLKLTS